MQLLDALGLQTTRAAYYHHGAAGHQIAHFEHFVAHDINNMLYHFPPVSASAVRRDKDDGKYQIVFKRARVGRPLWHEVSSSLEKNNNNNNKSAPTIRPLYPNEARLLNMTYASHIMMDVALQRISVADNETGEERCEILEEKCIPFGLLPIMVGSAYCYTHGLSGDEKMRLNECAIDEGGYFIIGGHEKVIMGQERIAHNSVFVSLVNHPQSPYTHKAEIRCVPLNGRNAHRTSNTAICITKFNGGGKQLQSVHCPNTESIRVILPHLAKSRLPIIILYNALGCVGDECRTYLRCLPDDMYEFCLAEANVALQNSPAYLQNANASSQTVALEYIGRLLVTSNASAHNQRERCILRAREVITFELLPHINMTFDDKANREKVFFLAHMVEKVFAVFAKKSEHATEDCRDHLAHKRVDLASALFCTVLKNAIDRATKQIGITLFRAVENKHRPLDIDHLVAPAAIHVTTAFRYAISSGMLLLLLLLLKKSELIFFSNRHVGRC